MSCRKFEAKGYLYLSGELSRSERKAFKLHLKECEECRMHLADAKAIWKGVSDLPSEKPAPSVRKAVLERSRRHRPKTGFSRFFEFVGDLLFFHPRVTYGIFIATASILLILVIQPMIGTRSAFDEFTLEWQDDFLAEADYLDKELDRLGSGVLLANYTIPESEIEDEEAWLSPMSQDLNWIRGRVENLVKTIYGI